MTSTGTSRYTVSLADLAEQHTAVVCGHLPVEGIPAFLGGAFEEVAGAAQAQGLHLSGPPFARYRVGTDGFDVEAGFPVSGPVTPTGRVEASTLPGGHVARTLHRGAYDEVAQAYQALESWVVDNSYTPTAAPWECYLDEPGVAEPRTEVFQPCAPAHR
jgi:effector-binding domain-containing protein